MTRREIIKQGRLALTVLALPMPLTAFTKFNNMKDKKQYDVIIIGGSYAGLSAAMALGRSLRNVLIIDNRKPCNIQTPHSQNFLTQDGKTPKEIVTVAKQQVEKYDTVKFHNGLATIGIKTPNGFEITTDKKDKFTAKKIIFATGIKDTMPDIMGFSDCWGVSVVHCPYCHGYEYRNKKTGIFANGERAFHLASMVNNLTKNLIVFTNGNANFKPEQIEKLNKHNILIIETKITEIEHYNGHIKNVMLIDKKQIDLECLYASLPFTQHSDIPVALGCELTELGYIKTNQFQTTNIDGVFACGDNSNMMRSVANAVYSGGLAGAMINGTLVQEQF